MSFIGPAFSNKYCVWCDHQNNPEKYYYLQNPIAALIWHMEHCANDQLPGISLDEEPPPSP